MNRRRFVCIVFAIGMAIQLHAEKLPPVSISEFLANNQRGLKDEDGEPAPWIELHNRSSAIQNLQGWFLTDTRDHLTKWRFPRLSILPEKYLVVFASGKDRARDLGHLHTNFRLNAQGGYLALVDPRTNVVSEFDAYPAQRPDNSFGPDPGEPAFVGRLSQPTPGKANPTRGPGLAPEVTFSPAGNTLDGPATVRLECSSSRAVIHYTLDGALPSSRSPIYRGPLRLARNVQLRARAYEEGLLPGPPHSESYLFINPRLKAFTSNLPVLVINTSGEGQSSSAAPGPIAHLSFFEPVSGRTSLTNFANLKVRATYHVRGSSTMNLPKSNFVLHLLDDFNQEQHHSVLGLPADSDWVLYGPNRFEPVMIHNPFVHQLSRDLGRYSPRTRFLEVFWTDGSGPLSQREYQGIYVLEEKIKVGKHRVDIDRLGPGDVKPPEVTGGYLLKIDRLGPGEDGLWVGEAGLVYVEPKERVISLPERAAQRTYLTEYFTRFERALHGKDWKDPVLGYRAYIDVSSWIDYHVLEVLSGNVDAFVFSTYFYKPREGKIVFGPHWDFDRALGSTDGRDDYPRHWNTGRFFSGPWWGQLFRDSDFWQLWVDRWQELRENQFSFEHLNGLIDRLADELREAQPREAERWDVQPRGGSYQAEVDLMKDWLTNRVEFIDAQLVPPPRLLVPASPDLPGQSVALIVPEHATVYYTVDGSDPRGPQGALSSSARIYTAPIRLTTQTHLVARARNPDRRQSGGPRSSTPWSGPVRAEFEVSVSR